MCSGKDVIPPGGEAGNSTDGSNSEGVSDGDYNRSGASSYFSEPSAETGVELPLVEMGVVMETSGGDLHDEVEMGCAFVERGVNRWFQPSG